MSYNFHIGQEVVCICAISDGDLGPLKKDEVYTIIELCLSDCSCKHLLLNIGLKSGYNALLCDCGRVAIKDTFHWYNSVRFAPLDSLTNIDELTEILSQPLFEVK